MTRKQREEKKLKAQMNIKSERGNTWTGCFNKVMTNDYYASSKQRRRNAKVECRKALEQA
jgi:hypothetical protein